MKLKVGKHKIMQKPKVMVTMYTTVTSSKLAVTITAEDLEVTLFAHQCQFSDQCWSDMQTEHQEWPRKEHRLKWKTQ